MRKGGLTQMICLAAILGFLFGNQMECRAQELMSEAEIQIEEVEQRVILEGMESGFGVLDEILVEYEDTKEYVPVKTAEILREYWSDDFEFPVMFYVYDADFYELGEYRIPRTGDGPGLEGYEEALLKVLGLSGADYVIEKVFWDGDVYVNEEGIQCRNAVARGKKRVRDYEVVYGIQVERRKEILHSEPKEKRVMEDAEEKVKKGDGFYAASGKRGAWKVIKTMIGITIAAGFLLLILLIVVLGCRRLIRWYRKRKREKTEQESKDMFDY